jgi:signal peptidase I
MLLQTNKTRLAVMLFVVCVIFVAPVVVEPMRVSSYSMESTLCDGDLILVSKLAREPRRGDIVVLHSRSAMASDGGHENVQRMMIKRVVAVPGDTFHITRGVVFVNREPIKEPYVHHSSIYNPSRDFWPKASFTAATNDVVVPQDNLFVMGDNREQSLDSRVWGPISQEDITGFLLLNLRNFKGSRCTIPPLSTERSKN